MNKNIYNLAVTIIRILLLITAIILIYIIITNLDAIKLLNSDPCAVCMSMNERGCDCWCGNITTDNYNNIPSIFNYFNAS